MFQKNLRRSFFFSKKKTCGRAPGTNRAHAHAAPFAPGPACPSECAQPVFSPHSTLASTPAPHIAALSVTAASYGTERDRDGGGCCAQRGISRRRRRKPRRWRRVREVCDTSTCEFILSNPLLYVKQKHMNYEYPRVRTHVKTSILWTIDFCVSSAHKCYDSYSISLARDVTRERGERV